MRLQSWIPKQEGKHLWWYWWTNWKWKKSSFKRYTNCSDDILELVCTNLCGIVVVHNYCGDKYFILFVDDFSKMMIVMFIKEKYGAFQMFRFYFYRVENETCKNINLLRLIKVLELFRITERGGCFTGLSLGLCFWLGFVLIISHETYIFWLGFNYLSSAMLL